jgi:hypothetical protein
MFKVGNISIVAYFVHGLVGQMRYSKADESQFTDDEIEVLLAKNGRGRRWVVTREKQEDDEGNVTSDWKSEDGFLWAVYSWKSASSSDHALNIITEGQLSWYKWKERDEAQRNLEGL